MALTEEQEMLLMAYADGELRGDPAKLAEAEALIGGGGAARTAVHDLQLASRALRDHVMGEGLAAGVDLSMLRGRVITRMPAPARAAPQVAAPTESSWFDKLFGWTRALGTGQLGLAGGAVMAAVMFALVLSQGQVTEHKDMDDVVVQPDDPAHQGPMANVHGEDTDAAQPAVIIEDMELDGGTVLFEGAEKPDEPMIIWHIQPDDGGAG